MAPITTWFVFVTTCGAQYTTVQRSVVNRSQINNFTKHVLCNVIWHKNGNYVVHVRRNGYHFPKAEYNSSQQVYIFWSKMTYVDIINYHNMSTLRYLLSQDHNVIFIYHMYTCYDQLLQHLYITIFYHHMQTSTYKSSQHITWRYRISPNDIYSDKLCLFIYLLNVLRSPFCTVNLG